MERALSNTDNPWMARRVNRCHGTVSERKTAKRLGGRNSPASGAMEGAKGDIQLRDFLIEAKCTKNSSISLKLDWLKKITSEAVKTMRKPALTVTYVRETGEPVRDGKYVIMREVDFMEMLDDLQEGS